MLYTHVSHKLYIRASRILFKTSRQRWMKELQEGFLQAKWVCLIYVHALLALSGRGSSHVHRVTWPTCLTPSCLALASGPVCLQQRVQRGYFLYELKLHRKLPPCVFCLGLWILTKQARLYGYKFCVTKVSRTFCSLYTVRTPKIRNQSCCLSNVDIDWLHSLLFRSNQRYLLRVSYYCFFKK